MNAAFPLAFMIGLFSALHCIGMCGGIVGALSYSLPAERREQTGLYLVHLLAFNLGRIGSYALAGALFAGLGGGLVQASELVWLDDVLRVVAAAVLVGIGLHIGGWFPRLVMIERLGVPLWRRLEPIGRRLLPVRSPAHALLFGAVWGWLPCGLVYTMLIGAPAQGEPLSGAIYMALFGLGSLPATLGTGIFAGKLGGWRRDPRLQSVAGVILVGLACFTLGWQT